VDLCPHRHAKGLTEPTSDCQPAHTALWREFTISELGKCFWQCWQTEGILHSNQNSNKVKELKKTLEPYELPGA